jgi:hypothetical protein
MPVVVAVIEVVVAVLPVFTDVVAMILPVFAAPIAEFVARREPILEAVATLLRSAGGELARPTRADIGPIAQAGK